MKAHPGDDQDPWLNVIADSVAAAETVADASGLEGEYALFVFMGLRSRLDSIGAAAPHTNVWCELSYRSGNAPGSSILAFLES